MKDSLNPNGAVCILRLPGLRFVDPGGHALGRVVDLVAELREQDPPITVSSSPDPIKAETPFVTWVEECCRTP